jgi:hypothetical protein
LDCISGRASETLWLHLRRAGETARRRDEPIVPHPAAAIVIANGAARLRDAMAWKYVLEERYALQKSGAPKKRAAEFPVMPERRRETRGNFMNWSTGANNASSYGGLTGVTPHSPLYRNLMAMTLRSWRRP